jgi:HEAT repeat protein
LTGSTLVEAAAEAEELVAAGDEKALATLRLEWDDELEMSARNPDFRVRAQAYRAIAQFQFRQKIELLRRGLEDESPACRGSALVALESLSRDHPGVVNQVRPMLHSLADSDTNQAVRRLAIVCLKNASPQPDTIRLLKGLADDDEQDRELRDIARKVSELLRKKSGAAKS